MICAYPCALFLVCMQTFCGEVERNLIFLSIASLIAEIGRVTGENIEVLQDYHWKRPFIGLYATVEHANLIPQMQYSLFQMQYSLFQMQHSPCCGLRNLFPNFGILSGKFIVLRAPRAILLFLGISMVLEPGNKDNFVSQHSDRDYLDLLKNHSIRILNGVVETFVESSRVDPGNDLVQR